MKETRIDSFTEFHEVIAQYDARTVIYRGMKSVEYPLIPKIGRIAPPASIGSREKNEQEILRLFKERAFQYLDFTPASDWDWLALGQQYACPPACSTGRTIPWSPPSLPWMRTAKTTHYRCLVFPCTIQGISSYIRGV